MACVDDCCALSDRRGDGPRGTDVVRGRICRNVDDLGVKGGGRGACAGAGMLKVRLLEDEEQDTEEPLSEEGGVGGDNIGGVSMISGAF